MKKKKLASSTKIVNLDTDIHVMPQDDFEDHEADANCWCLPYIDPKNDLEVRAGRAEKTVFVHKQIKYNKQELN